MVTLGRRTIAKLLVLALVCAPSISLAGQKTKPVHVKEYTKKDGTKVAAHDRKAPEHSPADKAATTEQREKSTAKTAPVAPASSSSTVARDAHGRIQRSEAARHSFARQTGYPNGRPGYVIDHITPLACGGPDTPANMQWQTIAEGKAKDRTERANCR
jgi:hypothetical protein